MPDGLEKIEKGHVSPEKKNIADILPALSQLATVKPLKSKATRQLRLVIAYHLPQCVCVLAREYTISHNVQGRSITPRTHVG